MSIKHIRFHPSSLIAIIIFTLSLEDFDATEKVTAFHLFAVTKIEFGAESGYNNRRNQIPPLDRSIDNTNRPIYNTTD